MIGAVPAHRMTFHLDAPPQQVFDYIADPRNEVEWSSDIQTINMVGNGPIGEGAVFASTYRGFGQLRLELREYRPPEHLVFLGDGDRIQMHFTLDLRPDDTGSLVTLDVDMRPRGALRLLTPLLKLALPREMAKRPGQLSAALAARAT
jgi:carbon monoxide dehydrogenase subunit G